MDYSFVIPCYCSATSIREVVREIDCEMDKGHVTDYEIIMVNDCSSDGTWQVLTELAKEDKRRVCLNLAKNVGQHAALMAGFRQCQGDLIVTLDDDLQTPIEGIRALKEKLDEGYDVASSHYTSREGFSWKRRFGSLMNRLMRQWLIDGPKGVTVSVFMMARRFVIDEIIRYDNPYPYLGGLVLRTTHNIANVEMHQKRRVYGHSGYNFLKLISLWMNGFTAFSLKPLRIADVMGIFTAVCGFIMGIVVIIRKLVYPRIALGWSSLMSVSLIMSGVIMLMLGLIGEYIGRIYMCINHTPQYVIKEMINAENNNDSSRREGSV